MRTASECPQVEVKPVEQIIFTELKRIFVGEYSEKKRKYILLAELCANFSNICLFCLFSPRYEKVPVILVGNKVDLESEREVSSNEGRALAEEWGCPFMETSAKSKTMVDELFAEIVRQMNYAAQPDKDDPCCSACNIQ